MGLDRRLSVFGGVGCTAAYFGHVGRMGQKKWTGMGFIGGGGFGFNRVRGLMGYGGAGFPAA